MLRRGRNKLLFKRLTFRLPPILNEGSCLEQAFPQIWEAHLESCWCKAVVGKGGVCNSQKDSHSGVRQSQHVPDLEDTPGESLLQKREVPLTFEEENHDAIALVRSIGWVACLFLGRWSFWGLLCFSKNSFSFAQTYYNHNMRPSTSPKTISAKLEAALYVIRSNMVELLKMSSFWLSILTNP